MKLRFRTTTVLTMMLLLAMALPVAAQERGDIERAGRGYVEEILKSLDVDAGGTLSVEAELGAIEVNAWSRDKLQVRVEKKYKGKSEDKAEKVFDNIEVFIKKRGDDVLVTVEINKGRHVKNTNVLIEVNVPDRYNVDLETRGGSISIDDLEGQVVAETAGGSISVGKIRNGDVDVETRGGSISIDGIDGGDGLAVTAGGSISVGDVTGTLKVKTAGGSIELEEVGGKTFANTSGGSISIQSSGDDLVAKTAGGSISVGQVEGSIKVNTAGGSISVGPAAGDVQARTSGGSIKVKESGGRVKAHTSGGSIKVDGSNGPVVVNTSGGSIIVDDAHGYIEAETAGGSIEAEMMVSDPDLDTHCTLVSSGGDLVLWIPEDLEATFDVELKITRWSDRDYEIMSDFPLEIDRKGRGVVCGGDINGGGDLIKLKTTNGDIEIRKLR